MSDLLDTTSQATDALARATTLLPAMLGESGARNSLVVFQNNSEWRSLGGVVGAMAVILVHVLDRRRRHPRPVR